MAYSAFQFSPQNSKFYASCSEGLSPLLQKEIKQYSLKKLSAGRAGIYFNGNFEKVVQFCLKSRVSSRISVILSEFSVQNADELYQKAKFFPWEKLFSSVQSFAIDANTRDNLAHSKFALYRLKDAIKDRLIEKEATLPEIQRKNPDYLILLRSNRNWVSLQLSLSAMPLHKRGYREINSGSPLRETLAQGLLYWADYDYQSPLIDPFCGSGTILIEAALTLHRNGNINYPLLQDSLAFRTIFGSLSQPHSHQQKWPPLLGYDTDADVIALAKQNAEKAGVADKIQFCQQDVRNLVNPFTETGGYIISNPPYGIRVGDKKELKSLFESVGSLWKQSFHGFKITLISGDRELPAFFRLKEDNSFRIQISGLKGKIAQYTIQ